MAKDITFLSKRGLTVSELLTIRSNANASLVSGSASPGQVITSVTTRDLSVSYGGEFKSPEEIALAATYALQKLDPDTYGTDLIRRKRIWVH